MSDLISRADAIKAVEDNSYGMGSRASVKAIKALPSADRPTHERDLISRHEALMELNGACEMWEDEAIVADIIHKLPSIEIVRCKDCEYYNPPHIQHNDGTRTDYPKKMVTCDIGTNVGGQCENPFPKTYCTNHERENPNDLQNLVIFRSPTDYCSLAKMKGGAE